MAFVVTKLVVVIFVVRVLLLVMFVVVRLLVIILVVVMFVTFPFVAETDPQVNPVVAISVVASICPVAWKLLLNRLPLNMPCPFTSKAHDGIVVPIPMVLHIVNHSNSMLLHYCLTC